MIELRTYQTNAINSIARKVGEGKRRIIFQLATGGGKSYTFAGLVKRFLDRKQQRCLLFVHRDELLKQARRTLYNGFEIVATPVTAGQSYLPNSMVYTAMVETAYNRLKKNKKYFGEVGLVIVDECHLGSFRKLYDFFPDSVIIGFTATPVAASKKQPLKGEFEDIVCGVDIPELIKMGSLVPNITYDILNVDRKTLTVKNGEYDDKMMGALYSSTKHVQNCVAAYHQKCYGKKTLVFNCNIEHSKRVNDAFLSFGYESRHLDGEADIRYRADTLAWFKKTHNAILHNVGVLTTGFDEPSVEAVIVNKATLSLPLWLQMTGRGSRPFPGKDHFIIVDMGSNAETHGDWSVSHDWKEVFFNPERPKKGGEAPSKPCIKCRVIIHASQKICPHCGALNTKKQVYDQSSVSFKTLSSRAPFECDVKELIIQYSQMVKKDGTHYKDLSVLHAIKAKLIIHAKRRWKLKKIDDQTAYDLLEIYQQKAMDWCHEKKKEFDWWHKKATKDWLFADLKSAFGWAAPQQMVQNKNS